MGTKRIKDLAEATSLQSGDYFAVDNASGTKKVDYTTLLDDTLTTAGKFADAKAVGDAVTDLEGQIQSDNTESDSVPYLFRSVPVPATREKLNKVVGGSVAWNQLMQIPSSSKSTTTNNVTYTDNRDGTYSVSTSGSASADTNIIIQAMSYKANHIYACFGCPSGGATSTYFFFNGGVEEYGSGLLYKRSSDANANVRIYVKSGTTISTAIKFKPQIFDLTLMLGSTIADYIYSLEQSTAGAGVAFFRKLFPADYYAYDAGTLKSVEGVSAHETVGFNQWDEETEPGYIDVGNGAEISDSNKIRMKNYMPVLPNTTYYKKTGTNTNGGAQAFWNVYYDENKNYISYGNSGAGTFTTPANCHYIRCGFETSYGTTYKNDICINLSDTSRNGTYEAYKKYSYPLDSSLTLRGILKKDSNNALYFDGDTYAADGTVTRRYGVRAYQSGDATGDTMITDGTNTVYKLSSATTETADPYQQTQICDPDGTEAFVTTGIVPVGHVTEYPHDLKGKVEQLYGIPKPPTANGTYALKATVSGSTITYSWV